METRSNGKKFLAIVCTLAMLASLTVSFGITASAAIVEAGTWGAETTDSGNSVDWSNAANHTADASHKMEIVDKGDQAHGGTKVVVASFNANEATAFETINGALRNPAAGRLGILNAVGSNYWYRFEFYYRVENLPEGTDAEIQIMIAGRNWRYDYYNADVNQLNTAATVTAATLTGEWIQAVTYYYNTGKLSDSNNRIQVAVVPLDNTQRSGMEIWLDDFSISYISSKSAPAEVSTVTLNYNDGGATANTTRWGYKNDPVVSSLPIPTRTGCDFLGWYTAAEGGDPVTAWPSSNTTIYAHWYIHPQTVTFHSPGATWQDSTTEITEPGGTTISSVVANPARDGYTFLGWSTVEGDAGSIVSTVPYGEDADVYAVWEAADVYTPNADTQTFEETTDFGDFLHNDKQFYLDDGENHTTAGGQSLRIDVLRGYRSQLTRPRLILKNGDSASASDFVAEDGESYRISFWVKSTMAMSDNSLYLYVAAMDPSDAATKIEYNQSTTNDVPGGGGFVSVHTLQSLTVPGANMGRENSINNASAGVSLAENVWTKVVIDINTFNGFNGADSLVELGIADENSRNYTAGNVVHHSLYIDDISIVKKSDLATAAAALDYQSFENETTGTDVDVKHPSGFTAVIADDGISHNAGRADANGKAVKITQTGGDSGVGRVQMYLTDQNGDKIQMEDGKRYLVSFWAYNAAPAVVDGEYVRPTLRFWVAPGDGTNAIAAATGDQKEDLKVYEIDSGSDGYASLEPTVWKRYTFVTTATNNNGDSSGYMVLGISAARSGGTYTQTFYIDDIAVTDIEHALKKPSGNVALYRDKDTVSYTYTKNDKEVASFRIFGGYNYSKFNYATAIIKSGACPIVGRGLILAEYGVAESAMTADCEEGAVTGGKILQNQYVTENLGTKYWGRKMGVMTYSMLITTTKKNADKALQYRPYLTVRVSAYKLGDEAAHDVNITLYGDVCDAQPSYEGLSLNRVAHVCGVDDLGWMS